VQLTKGTDELEENADCSHQLGASWLRPLEELTLLIDCSGVVFRGLYILHST